MSEAEERFLQLPDIADYTRVRQFNIDAKGAVIHRGDSFRKKRTPAKAADQQQEENAQKQSIANDASLVSEQIHLDEIARVISPPSFTN
jgi:hypothetical protein